MIEQFLTETQIGALNEGIIFHDKVINVVKLSAHILIFAMRSYKRSQATTEARQLK